MSVTCLEKHHQHSHADVHIAAVLGERRIVGYRLVNDAAQAIHVTPAFQALEDVTVGETVPVASCTIRPAGAFDVAAGASRELQLTIETSGLLRGHVYRTELHLGGTRIEPVSILLAVEPAGSLVGRHDSSRLRAWVRGCCFGDDVVAIHAPSQRADVCWHVPRRSACLRIH